LRVLRAAFSWTPVEVVSRACVFDRSMGQGSVAAGERDCFVLVALQHQNIQPPCN